MLYKFEDKDVYWTPTSWLKPVILQPSGAWKPGAEVAPAETEFIPAQLDLIQSKWFSFYSDKFLKKFLPAKIMLSSKVDSIWTLYVFTPSYRPTKGSKKVGAYYNYDNIVVNFGDASINTMNAADLRLFLAKSNMVFIQSILARGLTKPNAEFATSADYVTPMTAYTQSYGRGIIVPFNAATVQADWNAYIIAMVSYSTNNLNTSTPITDGTPRGILNPVKDINGLIKKRYNIVRSYFISEYGVDLQLVGNAAKGQ